MQEQLQAALRRLEELTHQLQDPAVLADAARYPALMREVNPYDRGAKLGADTLLRIMEVSRDVRPLEYMARLMGMRLERAQGKPSGE